MKAGIILKRSKKGEEVFEELHKILSDLKVEIFLEGGEKVYRNVEVVDRKTISKTVDFIIVLGGDGTFLSAVDVAVERDLPVLGINIGGLGFLTEISVKEMNEAIKDFLEGRCEVEERSLIDSSLIRDGEEKLKKTVLNDVVVSKSAIARLVQLNIYVEDQPALEVRADGVIISTPTGSTAYSLAAGGPILHPSLQAIIINPLCPHSLTVRPMVIPEKYKIKVEVSSGVKEEDGLYLTLDGQTGTQMKARDIVLAKKSEKKLKLVRKKERNYFVLLREKLFWGLK